MPLTIKGSLRFDIFFTCTLQALQVEILNQLIPVYFNFVKAVLDFYFKSLLHDDILFTFPNAD